MIPTSAVTTIAGEEASVVLSLKSHSEVIALRIERIAWMLYGPSACQRVGFGDEDVKSAHAGMTVGRKIQVAIGSEGGEFLVAGSIYRFTHILYGNHVARGGELCAPYIESSHSPRHI